jgi:Asp-tRNA(Asn)/Glu-tRNA(Gln) amidotransferase A subunit family amidase
MDRRTFLLGFLGSLAAAPTIITASSSVEAASVPEALPPVSQPDPEPVSSGEAEVDLEKVEADWSQYGYRRRAYRRGYRRTYRRGYRRAYRRGYRRGYYPRAYYPRAYYRRPYRRHARRVSRRVYRRAYRRRY